MNPTAIYSKTGKGVQEASGKTSHLSRPDRAVLSAIDGRATVADIAQKNGKTFDKDFEGLIARLDKDGFIREASPGVAPKTAAPAISAAKKPGAAPASPAGGGGGGGADLDFTSFTTPPASKPTPAAPAAPKVDPLANAKAEAEAKRAREAEALRARMEAEAKAKADAAARARAEADAKSQAAAKAQADAEARAKADAEAKARAAREAAERAALEAKAKAKAEAELKEKLEAERARAEAERKAREELEGKALAETSDLKKRLEEEKKAREEAERKAEEKAKKEAEALRAQIEGERKALEEERRREEEERKARKKREEDEERQRKEEAERQRKAEEEERKARKKREEEEERKRKEEAERQRKAEEEERKARKKREEEEERARKKAREEEEKREEEERKARKKREEEEERARRRQREEEEEREEEERKARKKREKEEAKDEEPVAAEEEDKPKKSGDSFGDSLLADLESFTSREEDDRKAKEEADRKEKEEQARRRKEEEERRRKEEEEEEARRAKEEEKARRKEEERREKEALEAKLKEEEERLKREEQRRKDEEEERKRKAKTEEQLAARATTARASEDKGDWERRRKQAMLGPSGQAATRKQASWGKPVAVAFFVLLLIAVGVIHVLPLSTAEYEKAASAAFGRPVKIGGARMSLYNGVRINFDKVIVGEDVRVAAVRATPQLGSLFSDNKAFSRVELEGLVMPQRLIGDLLYGGVRGDSLRVENLAARKVKLEGPLVLPEIDFDAALAADGSLRSAALTGPDNLLGRIAVKGSDIDFEINADGMPLPFGPEVTLSKFGMTGSANRGAMRIESWGGSVLDGQLKGRANVRWGDQVLIQGELRAAALNAAVFAPALLSEGRTEVTGRFTFNGPPSPKLLADGRFEGNFTVTKGVLGSFDLSRAIQSQGVQTSGRTQFNEMTGQAFYDAGSVSLRNVSIVAGALNAGASLEVNPKGEISGRIVADVRSPTQTLRATLLIGGTVREPQVRK